MTWLSIIWRWLTDIDEAMRARALAYEVQELRRRGCERGYEP